MANKRGVQPETSSKRNHAQTKRQCPVKREKALAPAAPQPISHLVANKAQRVREKGKERGYTINRACDNTNIYIPRNFAAQTVMKNQFEKRVVCCTWNMMNYDSCIPKRREPRTSAREVCSFNLERANNVFKT